jgi:hypothetical protein
MKFEHDLKNVDVDCGLLNCELGRPTRSILCSDVYTILATITWQLSPGNYNLGTIIWELSFGNYNL